MRLPDNSSTFTVGVRVIDLALSFINSIIVITLRFFSKFNRRVIIMIISPTGKRRNEKVHDF
jgi:hypothetical protein